MGKRSKFISKLSEYSLATLTLLVLFINTIIFFIPIFILGLLKLIPIKAWQHQLSRLLDTIPPMWIWVNTRFVDCSRQINWQIEGVKDLHPKQRYFIMCNHQTWMDIPVLQKAFNYKIPTLKPFIKSGLKWVPLLGFAWWVLDCPFMKRYSQSYLEKHPRKKAKDLKTTKKACEKFKALPVSILSFIEGTRFNTKKQLLQASPYQHLLKPKAGGAAYVLNAMGENLNKILDVTILYPKKYNTLWDYLCGRIRTIKVAIREITIPKEFIHMDLQNDPTIKKRFYRWLNDTWHEKDIFIQKTLNLQSESMEWN